MKGYIYMFSDGKVYVGQTRRHISIRHREHISPSTGPIRGILHLRCGLFENFSHPH